MNFLGHAYLSFNDPDILTGNMVSDFVKGKQFAGFPERIQQGIWLHRRIDEYTDSHPATHEARSIFRPVYRLYSAPIMDVLYDHFLANDTSVFNGNELEQFAAAVYRVLENNSHLLPPRFVHILAYMRAEDWLYNYRTFSGIEKSLRGLVRRSAFLKESETAFRLFRENHGSLEKYYRSFITDVKQFAKEGLENFIM